MWEAETPRWASSRPSHIARIFWTDGYSSQCPCRKCLSSRERMLLNPAGGSQWANSDKQWEGQQWLLSSPRWRCHYLLPRLLLQLQAAQKRALPSAWPWGLSLGQTTQRLSYCFSLSSLSPLQTRWRGRPSSRSFSFPLNNEKKAKLRRSERGTESA